MEIVVTLVNVLLMASIVFNVPRAVLKGSGSLALGALLAVVALVFATVSFTAAFALIQGGSSVTDVVLIILYAVMIGIAWSTGQSGPAT